MKPAVFLDRDGTIIHDVHYLADPAKVRLLPGSAEGIRLLRSAGYACIIVTNQSAIAKGLLTAEGLHRIQEELDRQLHAQGVALDGWYFCPRASIADDRTIVDHHDRKPGPGMLLRAAREAGIELSRSWMVGDMISDLLAGWNAGCKGSVLVRTGHGTRDPGAERLASHVAADLLAAAGWILETGRHLSKSDGAPAPIVP